MILAVGLLRSFSCWNSVVIYTFLLDLYVISRCINILFFVYRAKCAQGLNPVLSEKWFTKYIPRFLYIFYGFSGLIASYNVPRTPNLIICVSHQFSYRRANASLLYWLFSGLEVAITALMTPLFVVPLWRVYKTGCNVDMSMQQQRSKNVLKDALKYGVLMTAVNLLSSNIAMTGSQLYGKEVVALRYLSIFDPVINIGSTIMLLKRNRVLLWKLIGCKLFVKGPYSSNAYQQHPDRRDSTLKPKMAQIVFTHL